MMIQDSNLQGSFADKNSPLSGMVTIPLINKRNLAQVDNGLGIGTNLSPNLADFVYIDGRIYYFDFQI